LRKKLLLTLLLGGVFSLPVFGQQVDREVLEYVRAIRVQRGRVAYTVDVTISAAIPALSKSGIFKATKKHSTDKNSYEPVSFNGDGIIKTDVIGRYLNAELESSKPEEMLAVEISPLNYKFTPKGRTKIGGREALVYEVKPVHHHSGLFHGTVWLDPQSRLPLMEEGKLEKLPSIWLKDATFTRIYKLDNGVALPVSIHSEVKVRVIGKAIINVDFTNYRVQEAPATSSAATDSGHR
jgi:hypothetical protein